MQFPLNDKPRWLLHVIGLELNFKKHENFACVGNYLDDE
jgi:hypothetical protein